MVATGRYDQGVGDRNISAASRGRFASGLVFGIINCDLYNLASARG